MLGAPPVLCSAPAVKACVQLVLLQTGRSQPWCEQTSSPRTASHRVPFHPIQVPARPHNLEVFKKLKAPLALIVSARSSALVMSAAMLVACRSTARLLSTSPKQQRDARAHINTTTSAGRQHGARQQAQLGCMHRLACEAPLRHGIPRDGHLPAKGQEHMQEQPVRPRGSLICMRTGLTGRLAQAGSGWVRQPRKAG